MTPPDPDSIYSWQIAKQAAQSAGWDLLATGDWSWVYASPTDSLVWRITPFDPAFDAFVEVIEHIESPLLPQIAMHTRHPGGGSSTIMERLEPVPTPLAHEWLELFAAAEAGPEHDLRTALADDAVGRELPLFRGLDLTPGNVLARPPDGHFVLVDALWIDGPRLLELVEHDPAQALEIFEPRHLRDWAHLPCMDEATTAMILRQIPG